MKKYVKLTPKGNSFGCLHINCSKYFKPNRTLPIDLMLIHSCLIYHNILLNEDFSIKFTAK